LAVILPGAAKGQDPSPKDRVTLRVNAPDPNVTSVFQRAQRVVYDEYVRTHPEVNVISAAGLTMEGAGNSSQLLAIAGGVGPDVFSIYYQQTHSYIEQGFVAPVDEYLKTWEGSKAIPEQLWPVVTGRDAKRYGAIYTWPTLYLVYRRDLFEEAGLDPSRAPRNWDELYYYAMKLSQPDKKVETAIDPSAGMGQMGFFLHSSGSWIFSNYVWQAGGDIVQRLSDGSGRWKAVFDTPEAAEALKYYKKLRWQKWTRCFSDECTGKNEVYEITDAMLKSGAARCPRCGEETPIQTLKDNKRLYTGVVRTGYGGSTMVTYDRTFGRGEVAMVVMPMRQLQNVLLQNVVRLESIGIAPLPAGPTGIRASIVDGDVWVISSSCMSDKRKMDAAWEYIRFQTSDEARRLETKTYVEAGYARFVQNPHYLEKYGYMEYFNEIDPQHLSAFDEALKYGRPEPYCPSYDSMVIEMETPVSRIIRNENANPAAELKEVVKRINTYFFKLYPEEEMRFKRRVAVIAAVVAVALVTVIIYMLIKALAARVGAVTGGLSVALKASRWKHLYAWAFLLPAVMTIFLWSYLPLVSGSAMSFFDYKVLAGLAGSKFIGLDNFIEAVGQPLFWSSLKRTFFYSGLTMLFGFTTPIALAFFLAEVPRLKITFRMLFYLPALTSGLVIMFLWKDLFFNASPGGLLNRFIAAFGLHEQTWLQDPSWAMLCIILPGVWAGAGPGSIIYLAALKTVPEEMYEAAEIDGAGPLQKIVLVTLPYLKPLIIINFLGAFIGSFHATQNIFVMTMGGPEHASHTLSLEIFFNAFLYLKFGYATAMAWIMGSMLIGFTLYQLRIFQRVQFTAAGAN